jgi:hypothetical protein
MMGYGTAQAGGASGSSVRIEDVGYAARALSPEMQDDAERISCTVLQMKYIWNF